MVDNYCPCNLVGMTRFERATSRPQTENGGCTSDDYIREQGMGKKCFMALQVFQQGLHSVPVGCRRCAASAIAIQ